MDIKQNLAENIAKHRKAMSLTQAELANKLNYSDKAVSKWERGEAVPELTVLKQLADFFGVTIDDLLNEYQQVKPAQKNNVGKKRFAYALWSICIVWIVATLCYVTFGIIIPNVKNAWLCFIFAIPVTALLFMIFFSIWHKPFWSFIFSSILLWTVILSIFLFFLCALATPPSNLWFLFLLGIPIQLFLGFMFMFRKVK